MARFLLDTNVIIDVLNGRGGRAERLEKLLARGETLACCAVNIAEIYAGMRPKEEERTRAFLESLDYLEIDSECARQAGTFKRDGARKGVTLTLADCLVAAAAVRHASPLVTDNIKDFPMEKLTLFSPADL